MKKSYLIAIALSLLIVILVPLAAGCSSGAKGESSDYLGVADSSNERSGNSEKNYQEGIDYDYNASPKDSENAEPTGDGAQYERKIIKTVSINGETKEFDIATMGIDSSVASAGGYVESSKFSGRSISDRAYYYTRSATYAIRIPADRLDEFLSSLGDLINIVNSSSIVDDISAQYYDIVSRLATLEAEKTALLNMYEKASSVEYMLQIQERLYDVIEEIEANNTRLNYYKSRVAYSTVNLEIREVIEYTEQVKEPATFGERLSVAFKESWQNFADGWEDFTVGFVYSIPTLLVLAFIFGGIGFVMYLIIKKYRKKV